MKVLGHGDNTVIVELEPPEFNALAALIEAIGSEPYQPGDYPATGQPITSWLRAVRLFAREVEALKQARQLLERVEATLMLEEMAG